MLIPIIIIFIAVALIYPFVRWNHKHGGSSDCAPYQLMDEEEDVKITINGTITFKIEEKPLTPSQKKKRRMNSSKK